MGDLGPKGERGTGDGCRECDLSRRGFFCDGVEGFEGSRGIDVDHMITDRLYVRKRIKRSRKMEYNHVDMLALWVFDLEVGLC